MQLFFWFTLISFCCPAQTASVSARAKAIHDSAIVIDTHADTPQRFLDGSYDIGSSNPKDPGRISLDKAHAGNLGAEFFSIWVDPRTNPGHFAKHTIDLIDSVYEQAAHHPDRMMMAFSVADIERARKLKKLAALMGVEVSRTLEVQREAGRIGLLELQRRWSFIARGKQRSSHLSTTDSASAVAEALAKLLPPE